MEAAFACLFGGVAPAAVAFAFVVEDGDGAGFAAEASYASAVGVDFLVPGVDGEVVGGDVVPDFLFGPDEEWVDFGLGGADGFDFHCCDACLTFGVTESAEPGEEVHVFDGVFFGFDFEEVAALLGVAVVEFVSGGFLAVCFGCVVVGGGEEDDGDVALFEDGWDGVGDHVDAGLDLVVLDDFGDEFVGVFGFVDGEEAEDGYCGVDFEGEVKEDEAVFAPAAADGDASAVFVDGVADDGFGVGDFSFVHNVVVVVVFWVIGFWVG